MNSLMGENFSAVASLYKAELLDNVIPFWTRYSPDNECGGYFTCLDRYGKIYDTDKFVWLQGREAWMFSTFYNRIDKNDEWLNMAKLGIDFLTKYGRDGNQAWYFSLTRDGKPLIEPYNIFSDCFAAMAFAAFSSATGQQRYKDIAFDTFNNILKRSGNPKGKYSKAYPGTRPLVNFSLPMILCNLCVELEDILDNELIEKTIESGINQVMNVFYDSGSGLVRENVNPDGSFNDSFEGRLLNPGHAIEAMWFILDLAERKGDRKIATKAVEIILNTLNHAWDKEHGGIFYFMDIKGHPTQQLEWDQKLWWVHIESLIALIKGYRQTGDTRCLDWFTRLHEYTWSHFRDPEFGEWFGYLNRKGEVLLPLKGGKWKGCFHVPRGMMLIWKVAEELSIKADRAL